METLVHSTPEEYKDLLKRYVTDVMDKERRLLTGNVQGVPFVTAEDNIIMKYYYPGITADQKYLILQTCVGRDWNAIRRRAGILRRELISAGVYEIHKLPRLNHNANLGKEIEAGRKKAGVPKAKVSSQSIKELVASMPKKESKKDAETEGRKTEGDTDVRQ